jgi:hypothetical protein
MADSKKLPAYLGGYDPNHPESLGYFPAFFPGQLDALASQMAQGYGAATMQPTWGGPINAANGLPMAGVPANPALGGFGAAVPKQVLKGPTAADYKKDLDKVYTPMGSAVPKPVVTAPVVKPTTSTTTAKSKNPYAKGSAAYARWNNANGGKYMPIPTGGGTSTQRYITGRNR